MITALPWCIQLSLSLNDDNISFQDSSSQCGKERITRREESLAVFCRHTTHPILCCLFILMPTDQAGLDLLFQLSSDHCSNLSSGVSLPCLILPFHLPHTFNYTVYEARVGYMSWIFELRQGYVLPFRSLLVLGLVLLTTLMDHQLVAAVRLSLLLLAAAPPLLTARLLQQLVLEAGPFIFATAREVGAVESRTADKFVERRLPPCVELLPHILVPPLKLSVNPDAAC